MVIRHTLEQVQQYKDTDALNQSLIKVLIRDGIDRFLEKEQELKHNGEDTYEEKEHFIIGSAVDHHFSFGRESLQENFYLSRLEEKPKDGPMRILKRAFAKASQTYPVVGPVHAYSQQIWEAANEEEYYMNRFKADYQADTRIGSVIQDNGVAYWDDLKKAHGKQVLSQEENEKIQAIINSFENHHHTMNLMHPVDNIGRLEHIILIWQTPLYFNYDGINCKAMIDFIVINLHERTIIAGDIKTTMEDILNFNKAVRKHRYDIQASFYDYALRQNLHTLSDLVNMDISDFHVGRFGFATASTKNPTTPMIFIMDENIMELGRRGDERYLLGWEQGISKYKVWKDSGFIKENLFSATNGIVEIGHNFNYLENF